MPKPKRNSKVIYVGIDPGKSGGFAWYEGEEIQSCPMPTTELDLWHLIQSISKLGTVNCLIENVHSMPRDGRAAAFTFGEGFGSLKAFCCAAEYRRRFLVPRSWQAYLRIPPKRKTESPAKFKDRLLERAHEEFPDFDLWRQPRTKGVQKSVCDAMLIALVCKSGWENQWRDKPCPKRQTVQALP